MIEPPITVTGNPQFNFPNDVDKIQPKLQGGSFTLNSNSYISWDLFTSNTDLAQIDLNPATYSSDYAGLTISIVKIREDTDSRTRSTGSTSPMRTTTLMSRSPITRTSSTTMSSR